MGRDRSFSVSVTMLWADLWGPPCPDEKNSDIEVMNLSTSECDFLEIGPLK